MVAIHARDFVSSMRKAEQGGKVVYTYAQTTICDCLYVGDQAAYGRYRENAFQKNLAQRAADERCGKPGSGLELLGTARGQQPSRLLGMSDG